MLKLVIPEHSNGFVYVKGPNDEDICTCYLTAHEENFRIVMDMVARYNGQVYSEADFRLRFLELQMTAEKNANANLRQQNEILKERAEGKNNNEL